MGSRDLGMDRAITRRDFLNGVSVTIGGSLTAPVFAGAAGELQHPAGRRADDYPPARTGMRGSHPAHSRSLTLCGRREPGLPRRTPGNATTSSSSAAG